MIDSADDKAEITRPTEIVALAERVFGNTHAAQEWLDAPNPALEHETPSVMLRSANGAERVEAILLRIEHGVYE